MQLEPLRDEGQTLSPLNGLLIGVLDTREQVNTAVAALNGTGLPNSELILLHGEDGINLIERFDNSTFYFSDGPHKLTRRDKSVLAEGKYVLAIKVEHGDRARELAKLMKEHGGYGFAHFGMFVDVRFN